MDNLRQGLQLADQIRLRKMDDGLVREINDPTERLIKYMRITDGTLIIWAASFSKIWAKEAEGNEERKVLISGKKTAINAFKLQEAIKEQALRKKILVLTVPRLAEEVPIDFPSAQMITLPVDWPAGYKREPNDLIFDCWAKHYILPKLLALRMGNQPITRDPAE